MEKPFVKIRCYISFAVLPLFLMACSKDEEKPGLTLSGTVMALEGSDLTNVEVQACFIDSNGVCNLNSPNTKFLFIDEAGTTAPFRFTHLAEGEYKVTAGKRSGGELEWMDQRSYLDADDDGLEDSFRPSAADISLQLQPVADDLRILVKADDNHDLSGTWINFCYWNGQDCDPDKSFWLRGTYSTDKSNFGVQYSFMRQGDYVLYAYHDVNGDDEWDYGSCYTIDNEFCELVQPGTKEVFTINMAALNNQAAEAKLSPLSVPDYKMPVMRGSAVRDGLLPPIKP